MFDLSGRTALVTGSTRGLGWSFAQALAECGAHVVIHGRQIDDVDARIEQLSAAGHLASGCAGDLTELGDVDAWVGSIVEVAGALHILVNNAGVQFRAPFTEFPQHEWDRIMATNLDAPFALAQAAARHMTAAGFGRIVNVASAMSLIARPTIPAYVASKSALAGLTRAMAVELAPHGVTVNAVAPGYVTTDMNEALMPDPTFSTMVTNRTPAARWGTPAEIAAAVVFLVSDEASFVNGHLLTVDGGLTVAL